MLKLLEAVSRRAYNLSILDFKFNCKSVGCEINISYNLSILDFKFVAKEE